MNENRCASQRRFHSLISESIESGNTYWFDPVSDIDPIHITSDKNLDAAVHELRGYLSEKIETMRVSIFIAERYGLLWKLPEKYRST